MESTDETSRISRRDAMKAAGKALAGAAVLAALPQSSDGAVSNSIQGSSQPITPMSSGSGASAKATLRMATCQLPVSGNLVENARFIRDFMHQAAAAGAHLLHTSEACLSG